MDRIPVILDTDPGTDIDDVLAVAYLLKQPRCELVGVTTVTGDVDKRAALVEVMCRAAGRDDVPIVCGRSEAIAYGPGQPGCPHFDTIAHLPHTLGRKSDQAVDFLRKTIRSRPNEITLVSIGPLTNIATLFLVDPEIPFLVKNFYSMAGAFYGFDNKEWNCVCDPVASAVVASTKRKEQYWFGLDVTTKCVLKQDEVQKRFTGPLLETVLLMSKKFFEHSDGIMFHDPLAVASLFHPTLCKYVKGEVDIAPQDGSTVFKACPDGIDVVATEVNSTAFFEEFFTLTAS